MRELWMNQKQYEQFVNKIKIIMIQKGISRKELSEMTGYSINTINGFFSKKNSRFIAASICNVLEIGKQENKEEEWFIWQNYHQDTATDQMAR